MYNNNNFQKTTGRSRDVPLVKHIFNIYNKNYLNFSKCYHIKSDFDPNLKILIDISWFFLLHFLSKSATSENANNEKIRVS